MRFRGSVTGRREGHRLSGQALVELALILPVFLLLVVAALDLGRLFYAQVTLRNAAQQAAEEAATDAAAGSISFQAGQPCSATTNRVMCRVLLEPQGSFISVTPADVSLTCSSSSCPPSSPALGDTVTVRVNGRFHLITPLLAAFFSGNQDVQFASTAVAQMNVVPVVATTTSSTASTTTTSTTTTATTTTTTATTTTTSMTTTPVCIAPAGGPISVSPTSGNASNGNNATLFTFSSSAVTNMSTPGCNNIWSWSFGDGSGTSSAPNPTYSYGNSMSRHTATVKLVASNLAGNQTYTLSILLQ